TDLPGGPHQFLVGHAGFGAAGHHRHARGGDGALGADLVPHGLDGRRGRTDEHQVGFRAGGGEVGVLGEEPVAGVHGARPGLVGGFDDALAVQVALGGGAGAEVDGDVGLPDVPGVAV